MKTLPKVASIPLGVACLASAAVLFTIGFALLGGKVTLNQNP